MPTIQVRNGTLRLIDEPDEETIPRRLYRVLFTNKPAEHPGKKSWQLAAFKSVELRRKDLPMSALSLLKDGLTNRYFYVIHLCELHRDDTQVIASRDKKSMEEAYEAIDAALGPNKAIDASIKIENSTVVTGYVGRDAKNEVPPGVDAPKQGA